MTNSLTKEERRIIWIACNNAQSQGINATQRLFACLKDIPKNSKTRDIFKSWIEEFNEEFKMLDLIKSKLDNWSD